MHVSHVLLYCLLTILTHVSPGSEAIQIGVQIRKLDRIASILVNFSEWERNNMKGEDLPASLHAILGRLSLL